MIGLRYKDYTYTKVSEESNVKIEDPTDPVAIPLRSDRFGRTGIAESSRFLRDMRGHPTSLLSTSLVWCGYLEGKKTVGIVFVRRTNVYVTVNILTACSLNAI